MRERGWFRTLRWLTTIRRTMSALQPPETPLGAWRLADYFLAATAGAGLLRQLLAESAVGDFAVENFG